MAKRRILHLIAQAHLDPVWLWPWRDGLSETLTTMQSAVDRMRENPGMCFSRSSANAYRWAQDCDPRLFAEIRQRVREGRWEVVNGWIEQTDCNIPSTESFARQSLYGKGYFARELGADVKVGYNVDSFGHAGGLPQLLQLAGMKYYAFMRPFISEGGPPLLFWWESPDGARVLCWHIPHCYSQGPLQTADELEQTLRGTIDDYFAPGFDDGAFFLGVGNHGGGPTKRQLARIQELRQDSSLPELRFSTLEQYFAALEQSPAIHDIPVISTDLQYTFPGCYSAMGEIKALNRRAERTLGHAETLAVMAGLSGEYPYPGDKLRDAWWDTLFNQFHDILAGTCVEPPYRDARDSGGGACHTGDTVKVGAAHAMARRVDTSGAPEGVLFLANPLPWARIAPVEFDTFVAPNGEPITHLATPEGERIPLQWQAADAGFGPWGVSWKKLTATVALPPCGYRAFHLAHGQAPEVAWERPLAIRDDRLGFASLPSEDGTELLAGNIGLVVIDDQSDTWGHDTTEYRQEIGRPQFAEAKVVTEGPVRRIVRQKAAWEHSQIVMDIITYRELDLVELRLKINWQEQHKMLKLEVPTALQEVRTFAKVAGATLERVPTGIEEPGQDWVALQGSIDRETYTVGLINDSSYSYDCLDGLLRVALVRSAYYAEHDPFKVKPEADNPYLDQGWQERRFWLARGKGPYTALNLHRLADEAQTPAEYVMDSAHPGTDPWVQSQVEVQPASVAVTAIKQAEDGDGLIIRVQEMHGMQNSVQIRIPSIHLDFTASIAPWEIKTFKVVAAGGKATVVETDLLERETAVVGES